MTDELQQLRERLSIIDDGIVDLLNTRCSLVLEVAEAKQRTGVEIYDPEREAKVIDRAKKRSKELPSSGAITIFNAIFSVCRDIQQRVIDRKPPTQQWTAEIIMESAVLKAGDLPMLALPKDRLQHLQRIAERHEQERR